MFLHIISRSTAINLGLKRYFYSPCKNGHFGERLVVNNACVVCTREKAAAGRARDPEAARAKWRAQHQANKENRNSQSRRYRSDNPEKWQAIDQASKAKRAAAISEYMRSYRDLNATKISQQNAAYREKTGPLMNERTRKWRRENPGVYLSSKAKRRSAELQALPAWADIEAIKAVYEEAAKISAATNVPHHVDHDIPLRGKLVCGLHVHTNLKIIPALENLRKSNRFDCS